VSSVALDHLTDRGAVLRTFEEFDQLGEHEFLRKYDYRRSREWFVLWDSRRYPAEAIVGAAHGFQFPDQGPLSSGDLSGRSADVLKRLEALGFETRRRWGRLQTPARRLMALVGALGAIVGLALGVLQLIDILSDDGPPIDATIKASESYEPDVQWGDFHQAHPEVADGPFSSEQRRQLGVIFTLKLSIQGLKGEEGVLRWRIRDQDGAPVSAPAWVPDALPIRPEQDVERLTQPVWVPLPDAVDEFFAEFTFSDHKDQQRDSASGPTVAIGRN
jgi:hypothetical protein